MRAQGGQHRTAPQVGAVLDGRWSLRRLRGRDGAGARYDAVDLRSERAVHLLAASQPVGWDAAWLDHPNVLRTLAAGASEHGHYVVQDPLPGAPLTGWDGFPIELPVLLSQVVGIADALDRAHEATGQAHGSLGLHSLWRTPAGRLRLVDLAVAGGPLPRDAEPFAAPERLEGRAVDPSADQYALAAVLHLLATGTLPGDELDAGLPRSLEQLLRIALAEHPSWRFPTMRGMKRALERALADVGGVISDASDVTTFVERPAGIGARVPPPSAFRGEPEPESAWLDHSLEPEADPVELDEPGGLPLAAIASAAAGLGFGLSLLGGLAVLVLLLAVLVVLGVEGTAWLQQPAQVAAPVAAAAPVEAVVDAPVAVVAPVAHTEPPAAAAAAAAPVAAAPAWEQAPVSFAYDSWEIRPGPEFARFAHDVEAWDGTVLLTGHTDTRGSADANEVMGLGRAWAVEVGLLAYEVPDDKVEIDSAGERQPLTRGTSAADHARNRRVTVSWE